MSTNHWMSMSSVIRIFCLRNICVTHIKNKAYRFPPASAVTGSIGAAPTQTLSVPGTLHRAKLGAIRDDFFLGTEGFHRVHSSGCASDGVPRPSLPCALQISQTQVQAFPLWREHSRGLHRGCDCGLPVSQRRNSSCSAGTGISFVLGVTAAFIMLGVVFHTVRLLAL